MLLPNYKIIGVLSESIHSLRVWSQLPPAFSTTTAPPQNSFLFGTHDGNFHCDEAMALSLLLLHPTYHGKFDLIRTRNTELLQVQFSVPFLVLTLSDSFASFS
jgi:hypothetical protein